MSFGQLRKGWPAGQILVFLPAGWLLPEGEKETRIVETTFHGQLANLLFGLPPWPNRGYPPHVGIQKVPLRKESCPSKSSGELPCVLVGA